MKNFDLTSYYPAFKFVIYLAEQRNNGKEKDLTDFLNSLDFEVIKALQTIMYVGRDASLAESDGTYSYQSVRELLDRQGWNHEKDVEVNQMVEKADLEKYLKKGFEKLNIKL